MDPSNTSISSIMSSDAVGDAVGETNIEPPADCSIGYDSEPRDITPPPALPPRAPRDATPPASHLSSRSQNSPSTMLPASMTSSWAGGTPLSKSKPHSVQIQMPSKSSVPTGNDSSSKMKTSAIHIPPKPKVPPPKRPVPGFKPRPALPSVPPTSCSGVKMAAASQKGGIQVSISRPTPSAAQSNAHSAPQASQTTTQRTIEVNADSSRSPKTTIDVRPSPGSTVKVKVIGGGGGSRPQPQPRSIPGQSGCIPLTKPLRIGTTSSGVTPKRTPQRIGTMSQPPPPPPHSDQLQQRQQPPSQAVSKPRSLAPKPQVSPRKTILSQENSSRDTNSRSSETKNNLQSSHIASTYVTSTTVSSSVSHRSVDSFQSNKTSISNNCSDTHSSSSSPSTDKSRNALSLCSLSPAPSSLSSASIAPLSSEKKTVSEIQIKTQPSKPMYTGAKTNLPAHNGIASDSQKINTVDSCTFTYKSPEKSFFTQTFFSKENSGKVTTSLDGPKSPSSPLLSPFLGKSDVQDRRHLGFIREDLKSGDKQSRMRHAELILKRSDELFQDAWSFLNASGEDIDRRLFGEDAPKSHSPSPARSHGGGEINLTSGRTRADLKLKEEPSLRVSNEISLTPVGSVTDEDVPLQQTAKEQEVSVPWKVRKERIDTALSWLKRELASLRDMDKNIVNQFRRCQDTIETLKSQREVWEGLSEEGEEAEYWDDLEINEFNRNYLNSPEGSSLSPLSTGSHEMSFNQDICTDVSIPVPSVSSNCTKSLTNSLSSSVTQDVEATL